MPKPLFGDNGSGMHTHQSLWKDGKPLFSDAKATRSPARCAAGTSAVCSARPRAHGFLRADDELLQASRARLRSAGQPRVLGPQPLGRRRIPMYTDNPKAKRIEFRPPDPTANPYLAFSAMLMAGLDGIQNKIDPGAPLDKNIYELVGPRSSAA